MAKKKQVGMVFLKLLEPTAAQKLSHEPAKPKAALPMHGPVLYALEISPAEFGGPLFHRSSGHPAGRLPEF